MMEKMFQLEFNLKLIKLAFPCILIFCYKKYNGKKLSARPIIFNV